jgi:hypothetical protein
VPAAVALAVPDVEYVAPAGLGVIVGPWAEPVYVNDTGEIVKVAGFATTVTVLKIAPTKAGAPLGYTPSSTVALIV